MDSPAPNSPSHSLRETALTGKSFACFFFLLILWLPIIQLQFHLVTAGALIGVKEKDRTRFEPVTLSGLLNGTDQARFQKWFDQAFGFREYLIKLHNQLIYSLFHESPTAGLGEGLILGKRREIYGIHDVEPLAAAPFEPAKLDKIGDELFRLQLLLQARGISFVVLITPNKANLYPENLPDQIRAHERYAENKNYELFAEALRNHSVHTVDGFSILRELKDRTAYPLFPQGGFHWNDFAAFHVLDALLRKLESLSGGRFTRLVLNGVHVDHNGHGPDMDGADTLNLWAPPYHFICPRPLLTSIFESNMSRPRILFEGGSYDWILLGLLQRFRVSSNLAAFFYYTSYIDYSEPQPDNRVIMAVDWDQMVFNRDAIVLEINLARLTDDPDQFVQGFVRDAIIKLSKAGEP